LTVDRLSRDVELVRRRAADLAARLSAAARGSASIAQERAVLRMLGVDGLDRAGRPLASSVSDRYCSELDRLAGGVLMPLTVAMLEYDLPAREAALEVASGAIDLRLEAELLDRPDRLLRAEQRATAMLESAIARIDANRTATREMRDVLGLPPEPRLGVAVRSSEVEAAASEVRSLVRQGAGVVEVRVPAGWELTETWRQAGLDAGGAFGRGPDAAARGPDTAGGRAMKGLATVRRAAAERARLRALRRSGSSASAASSAPEMSIEAPIPAGSQRGLARLRKATDEASAERDCYASLMTVTSALAAPEQAIVAAFERIDIVESDPIREIVEDNVDPERALADHSFAHRIEARAGSHLLLGAGPLALGPDIAAGVPTDGLARAGRALALQALGVELALADGLGPERIFIGCVPSWIVAERDASQAPMQALIRRLLFPDHQLVIVGPAVGLTTPSSGAALSAALTAAHATVVLYRAVRDVSAAASDLDSIAAGATAARADLLGGGVSPSGDAGGRAGRIFREAVLTLERLDSEGWASVLGPTSGRDHGGRLGRSAVVDRARGSGHSADLIDRFF
jgi:hypothetical protein